MTLLCDGDVAVEAERRKLKCSRVEPTAFLQCAEEKNFTLFQQYIRSDK